MKKNRQKFSERYFNFVHMQPVFIGCVCICVLTICLANIFTSCDRLSGQSRGTLNIDIENVPCRTGRNDSGAASPSSLSDTAIPDKEDFILEVLDSKGRQIYRGRFGESPEAFSLSPGPYTVSAYSAEFEGPAFDSPQFGDSRLVVIQKDSDARVQLTCSQTNSGVRLDTDDSFREVFPDGCFVLSSDNGSLDYGYEESGYAFFRPGTISAFIKEGPTSRPLFKRRLEAGQMFRIRISSPQGHGEGSSISLQIDSSRTWVSEDFSYRDRNASYIENAYSVTEAIDHSPESDVWVLGYITGVATGTGKFSFTPPFSKNTNLLLGLRENGSDPKYCLSVELKSGVIRDELNLEDNPSLKGRQIYMKGDLVSSYYGIPGLKNVSEYQFRR